MKELGDGAVIILEEGVLQENADGTFTATTAVAADYWELCPSERFSEQLLISAESYCSGFLLSTNPPWIGTAAHCVEGDLSNRLVVFGFQLLSKKNERLVFQAKDVFKVKRLVVSGEAEGEIGADFGVIELDKNVVGYSAYKTVNSDLKIGDKLTVIGYPIGLPKKTDSGGSVNAVSTSLIQADTDSYGGNSGSPAFDSKGRLAAILVGGTQDLVSSEDSCLVSNVCPGGPGCDTLGEELVPICAIMSNKEVSDQLGLNCPNAANPGPVPIGNPDESSIRVDNNDNNDKGHSTVLIPFFAVTVAAALL